MSFGFDFWIGAGLGAIFGMCAVAALVHSIFSAADWSDMPPPDPPRNGTKP